MPRKVLIAGGARFHGLKLVEGFHEKGDRVYVLNRGNRMRDYASGIEHLKIDRDDADGLKRALQGLYFDIVIDNNAYRSSQAALLLELLGRRCGHYIFTSTAAVYLALSSGRLLKEDGRKGGNNFYPPEVKRYAMEKLACEKAVMGNGYGVNYTIIRLPNVFGEGDFVGKMLYFYRRLRDGGKILLEKEVEKFSLIYVGDVIKIYEAIAENPGCFSKILNAADPTAYDYHEFFGAVFGDIYDSGKIVLAPARKIWDLGYRFPIVWSPPLDTSSFTECAGGLTYLSPSVWGRGALRWELEHLNNKESDAEYERKREHELVVIGLVTSHRQRKEECLR